MSKPPISSSVCPHCGHALNARAPVHVGAGLAPEHKQVLDFIRAYVEERGYSPSYEEIAAGLNYSSKATVARRVHALVARGHITQIPGHKRSIALVSPIGGHS